jgi:hypothetical protein
MTLLNLKRMKEHAKSKEARHKDRYDITNAQEGFWLPSTNINIVVYFIVGTISSEMSDCFQTVSPQESIQK